MPTHPSIPFDIRRTIWRGALVGSVSAALVIASIGFGLEISIATAHSGVAVSEGVARQIVNHAHKGDRQQLAPAGRQNAADQPGKIGARKAPGSDLKLAIGCESMISPLANPLLARVARRCLS